MATYIATLNIPIKRPLWPDEIEAAYASSLGQDKQTRSKIISGVWDSFLKNNPGSAWNVKTWRYCLQLTATQIAKHYNARVAEFVLEIETGRHFKALGSFGRTVPEGMINLLPTSIREGIGDKLASNTSKLWKFEKKPPYSKGEWIKINRTPEQPFQFEFRNGQFMVLDLDLPNFTKPDRFANLAPIERGQSPKFRRGFVLDLYSRIQSENWLVPNTYENNVKRLVNGEIFSHCCEIVKTRDSYMLHFVVELPVIESNTDGHIVAGVDIGLRHPVVASCGEQVYEIKSNEYLHMQRAKYRLDQQRKSQSGQNRLGHGVKNKHKPVSDKTERHQRRQHAWVLRVAANVDNWLKGTKASLIQMEDLSNLNDAKRIKYPYKALQQQIEWRLKKRGVEVVYANARYTSRRCPKCGAINDEFDFKYRIDKKNWTNGRSPGFVCQNCGHGKRSYVDGDRNAAKNLEDPGVADKITKQAKKQKLIAEDVL